MFESLVGSRAMRLAVVSGLLGAGALAAGIRPFDGLRRLRPVPPPPPRIV